MSQSNPDHIPRFAAIQMASGPNVGANLTEALRLINLTVAQGANFVVLPENFAHMGMQDKDILDIAEDLNTPGEILNFLSTTAQQLKIWLLGGTIPLKTTAGEKILSASILFNDRGEQVAQYNKVHLFDVDLSEKSGVYNESGFTHAGSDLIVTPTPFGKVGLGICYDIRFPEMFRRMEKLGMEILLLPSSFTEVTGKAHWEILNRSRAIENLCFVVSSAQGGYHVNGRETHGNSMIINPWGKILDRLPNGSGYIIADIDISELKKIRKNFPVLEHRRIFCNFPEQI